MSRFPPLTARRRALHDAAQNPGEANPTREVAALRRDLAARAADIAKLMADLRTAAATTETAAADLAAVTAALLKKQVITQADIDAEKTPP